MPGFDGTGPLGDGPTTGRGMGRGVVPTAAARGPGRGRGYGWMYHATGVPGCMRYGCHVWASTRPQQSREEEVDFLQQQANRLRNQLDAIEERLGNLVGHEPESGE